MSPATPPPDHPLTAALLRWRAGSASAGDRLFAGLSERLRPWIAATTQDLGVLDGEDVLQDVFLTFLHHADGFDVTAGDPGLLGWFRTTLRRRWWSLSARARRDVPMGDGLDAVADEAVGHDGEERAEAAARLRTLEEAAADPARVRVSDRNRRKIARFLSHVEDVVLGGRPAARTSGELGERIGWTPYQLWKAKGQLREAVAPVLPPAEAPASTPHVAEARPVAALPAASPAPAVGSQATLSEAAPHAAPIPVRLLRGVRRDRTARPHRGCVRLTPGRGRATGVRAPPPARRPAPSGRPPPRAAHPPPSSHHTTRREALPCRRRQP